MSDARRQPGSESGRSGGDRPGPFFLDLSPEYRGPKHAAVCLLPVPYDATSSWVRGARRGPAALIAASNYVELYDIETGTEPYRHGIATLPSVDVTDGPTDTAGSGEETDCSPEELAERVEARVGEILDRSQLPVLLGGEHSVTVGAVRAAAARMPDLSVLQIDAHGDTRETYHGSSYNHACVMARVREICPVVQVGIRSLDTSEVDALDAERILFAHDIVAERTRPPAGPSWIARGVALLTDEVYVTVDVDGFDPSVIPATGTPEPGGLDWSEVNGLLTEVARSRRVVGFDVVELLDLPGHHASAFTAAKLVYRLLAEILAAR